MNKLIIAGLAALFSASLSAQTATEKKETTKAKTETAVIKSEKNDKAKATNEMHSDANQLKANRAERTRMEKQYFADRKKLNDPKLSKEEKAALQAKLKEEKEQLVQTHRKENAKQREVKQDQQRATKDSKAIENAEKSQEQNTASAAPHKSNTVKKPRATTQKAVKPADSK